MGDNTDAIESDQLDVARGLMRIAREADDRFLKAQERAAEAERDRDRWKKRAGELEALNQARSNRLAEISDERTAEAAALADLTRDRDRWLRRASELQERLDAVAEAMRPPDIGERLRGSERPLTREWVCGCLTGADELGEWLDARGCAAVVQPCDARRREST